MFSNTKDIQAILFIFSVVLSVSLYAGTDEYRSLLVNETNQHHNKYRLIKTRMWPNDACLLDSGKVIVNPGETTTLRIKKDATCDQAGVGYEIYPAEDTEKQHLLGYLSHRFADEKFSVQISRFCKGERCVFADLNPEQERKHTQ